MSPRLPANQPQHCAWDTVSYCHSLSTEQQLFTEQLLVLNVMSHLEVP